MGIITNATAALAILCLGIAVFETLCSGRTPMHRICLGWLWAVLCLFSLSLTGWSQSNVRGYGAYFWIHDNLAGTIAFYGIGAVTVLAAAALILLHAVKAIRVRVDSRKLPRLRSQ